MRNIFPDRLEYTTKAHQDYPNVQGTTDVYTAWMPLIDCPPELGGLQVARGSHTLGVLEFGIGTGAGGIEILDPLEGRWTGGPMRAGDVLVFHSLTVHKGSRTGATACGCRSIAGSSGSGIRSILTTPTPTASRSRGTRCTRAGAPTRSSTTGRVYL